MLPLQIIDALLNIELLSERERAVFELLGVGCGNRSIACALGISEGTVKCHVTAILGKLGLESRLQAGLVAFAAAQSNGVQTNTAACQRDPTKVGLTKVG